MKILGPYRITVGVQTSGDALSEVLKGGSGAIRGEVLGALAEMAQWTEEPCFYEAEVVKLWALAENAGFSSGRAFAEAVPDSAFGIPVSADASEKPDEEPKLVCGAEVGCRLCMGSLRRLAEFLAPLGSGTNWRAEGDRRCALLLADADAGEQVGYFGGGSSLGKLLGNLLTASEALSLWTGHGGDRLSSPAALAMKKAGVRIPDGSDLAELRRIAADEARTEAKRR